ncbi:MAG: dTDP-4-dehydrorhamnose 3,5-epimerase [Deltaproteobacteria bacterium]|jgi:dTDP-4-dehydrorhamnose 3,5-epimerase|nr:dTDP-4-dehydrorhamnose 3,5-epimerase [Deltaproteobacteria bacterium]
MKFSPTKLPDVILVEPDVFGDNRGFFMETWHAEKFAKGGIVADFVQDNHSRSGQGILRGLHYQINNPQGKLVRVLNGEVFDVAVDLRKNSPTFGKWIGIHLSAENKKMLWVPPGFAHGFYVISPQADFFYKCTEFYTPENERAILWNDPDLAIDWPLVEGKKPVLAPKDEAALPFNEAEYFD